MCGCCCGDDTKDEPPRNPLKNRGCTDIIFLIIFIAFWCGMIYVAAFSLVNGDGWRLLYGYDSYGNVCNKKNEKIGNMTFSGMDMTGKSYVFYADVRKPWSSLCLCVRECPTRDLADINEIQVYSAANQVNLCRYDIPYPDYPKEKQATHGPCPVDPVYNSMTLLNRCFPKKLSSYAEQLIKFVNEFDLAEKVLADMYTSWREMLYLCLISVGIALLVVLLIRFMASVIVWVIMILAGVASIAGTAFLWWTYADMKNKLDRTEQTLKIPLLDIDVRNEQAFLVFSIIATVLTVILLLVMIVMIKRVRLVVALFHEAGKFIQFSPILLLQPIWTTLMLLVFFAYWLIVLAFLTTSDTPMQDKTTGFIRYEQKDTVRYLWWYHLIGLIWTSEFILACQQMAIAGAVATWYFTRDKKTLSCPVGKAVCRLIMHHLGSVALGAFIITLVKLPRMILMYLQKKLKSSQNECAQYCLKCCICCLWCLEKCLKFLNQNAYTIIAIEGTHFCASARRAFSVLVSNVLRVAAINSVGDFVLFLGKIGVTAATGAIGTLWLKNKEGLHYFAIPVLMVCVFAYFIAHCFLSIYEMVVDTLLLCFCEDCQMNDGTEGKEYYMSNSLMKYVEDAKGKLNTIKGRVDPPETDTVDAAYSAPVSAAAVAKEGKDTRL